MGESIRSLLISLYFPLIMFRIASSLSTRRTVWISENNEALPSYLHAGKFSSYKGSTNRYRCNPEAPRISFFI